MLQHDGADEHHGDVGHEGCAGVHEHTDEDGHHGIGQQIDVNEGVAHEECGEQGEQHNQGIEHGDAARLVEIVTAIEGEIEREANHEDGHIDDMAHQTQLVLLRVVVTPLVLLLERLDDAVGLVGDDFAAVYNLLTFLHQTAGQGNTRQQVVQAGFAALFVVHQIGHDIVVQVALLQRGTVGRQLLVEEQLLVGALGGVQLLQ